MTQPPSIDPKAVQDMYGSLLWQITVLQSQLTQMTAERDALKLALDAVRPKDDAFE